MAVLKGMRETKEKGCWIWVVEMPVEQQSRPWTRKHSLGWVAFESTYKSSKLVFIVTVNIVLHSWENTNKMAAVVWSVGGIEGNEITKLVTSKY